VRKIDKRVNFENFEENRRIYIDPKS